MRWGSRMAGALGALMWVSASAATRAQPSAAGAAVTGAGGAAAAAPVQAGRVALVYTRGVGAATCDSETAFREWLATELGADPFLVVAPPLATARVLAAPAGGGFTVTLLVEDVAGREVAREARSGRTCNDALDRLAIDVLLDLFRRPAAPPSASAPACEPAQGGEPATECDPCEQRRELDRLRAELERMRRRMWRLADAQRENEEEMQRRGRDRADRVEGVTFALSTGAFLTLGLTNNVGGGVLLGGEVHSGIFAMGLEARVTLPSQIGPNLRPDHYDTRDYSTYQGALVPCARYWYVFGCAVVAVGAEVGYQPLGSNPSPVHPVWDLGPRLGVEVPLNRVFALRAWGEVLFNPIPTRFHWFENGVEIAEYDLPVGAGFIGAGLVIHFGKKE